MSETIQQSIKRQYERIFQLTPPNMRWELAETYEGLQKAYGDKLGIHSSRFYDCIDEILGQCLCRITPYRGYSREPEQFADSNWLAIAGPLSVLCVSPSLGEALTREECRTKFWRLCDHFDDLML